MSEQLDLDAIRARVEASKNHWFREDVPALLAEVERLRDIERAWRYDRQEWAAERDAARAEVAALRGAVEAVCSQIESMPIPADPGTSQTEITGRVVTTIVKAVRRALLTATPTDPKEK